MVFEKPIILEEKKWLSQSEREALRNFNRHCDSVRGEFKRGVEGLAAIRETALQLFIGAGYPVKHLVGALFALRPHWGNGGMGEATVRGIFARLHAEKDIMQSEDMFVSMSTNRFLREMEINPPEPPAVQQLSDFEIRQLEQNKYCVIHPDRPWANKRLRLCGSCYQKLWRLDLIDHPLDAAIIEVLKKRLTRGPGNKFTPKHCVNHGHRIALPNGLCVRCNEGIGVL